MKIDKIKQVIRSWLSVLKSMMDDEEFKAFVKSLVEENVV